MAGLRDGLQRSRDLYLPEQEKARDQAEDRVRKIQSEIDGFEAQIERLEHRDDPEYEKWREHAHKRRYRPPETTRILDVEFALK